MNELLVLRDATDADAEALCEAERQVTAAHAGMLVSLPHELQASAFLARIENAAAGRGKYLVALAGENVVGHASLYPMERQQLAHVLRLDMCVHLGQWNKGYGRTLLNRLLEWARTSAGNRKVELLVRSSNTAAVKLYLSCGFVEEGRHRDRVKLVDGEFVDDIAMALMLTGSGA